MDDRYYREEMRLIVTDLIKRLIESDLRVIKDLADPADGEAYPLIPEKDIEA